MNPGGRPGGGFGAPGGGNRPSFGNSPRPGGGGMAGNFGGGRQGLGGIREPGEIGRPSRPGSPGIGNRPGLGGGGDRFPGMAGGGNRPGLGGGGDRFPGIGGGGDRFPGMAGGGNRPGIGGGGDRFPGFGGGTRPGQGGGGERWPGIAGGGLRPGQGGGGERWPGIAGGGNRPGDRFPGFAGNGNRPITGGGNASGSGIGSGNAIGSGNIGSGNNIGQIGDNLGIVNRPNYGGNTSIRGGNTVNNINNTYASGYNSAPVIAGNIGGGYGNGRGYGYGGYGYGGYGGGWASPYYGNWYRGSFGNGGAFLGGFGLGALTSFGLGSLYSGGYGAGALGYGGYGYGSPIYASTVYNNFPTWGMGTYADWGLGSVASNWLYNDYANPYYSALAAADQPAAVGSPVYDYSQPINIAAAPPDPSLTDSTEQVFSAARDRFKAGDYQGALDLADQVLKQTPNAAVIHEFRGLALFALKRYDDAAATDYAVLSAGPGWNWTTMIGLYPDADTYTNQLRALEAYARENANSSSARFLLGYHYMIEGHNDEAAKQFRVVTQLLPSDQLSASFAKALGGDSQQQQVAQATPPPPGPAPAGAPAQGAGTQAGAVASAPSPPPAPPAALDGNWKAQPAPEVTIGLTLKDDGHFTWDVDTKGQKQSIEGQAGFQDGNLILQQAQGPPLVGKVTQNKPDSFVFAPPGSGDKGGGLVFHR